MTTFFRNMKKAIPSSASWVEGIVEPKLSLEALQKQASITRTQLWVRRVLTFGEKYKAAKPEFWNLVQRWKTPLEFTGRDVVVGAVWGIHLYGSFCIGEMIGRGSIAGYNPGRVEHHH